MSHPKIQHYVPQFLLAAFEISGESRLVHVFDKQRGRAFVTNVRNVAAERAFYDVVIEDATLSFERSLGKLEEEAAKVLARVIELGQVGFLREDDRIRVASFVLAQNMRTRQFLESVHEGGIALAAALDRDRPGTAAALGFTESREQSKVLALDLLRRSIEWVPLMLQKTWSLYEAPPGHPFWIGDHPVAMANNVLKSEVRGTIGLAVEGIEIHLPLTPRYCLGLLCPTLKEKVTETYARSLQVKTALGIETKHHDDVGALRDGLEYGFSIPSRPENVEYVNSLQVMYSERFVFSSQPDFVMVEEMIAKNEELRRGPRPEIA